MSIVEWDYSLSVNVEEIDLQHKWMLSMINELSSAMEDGRGREIVRKTIFEMINYSVIHFETEESFFDLYAYPHASQHKDEHTDFINKTKELKKEYEAGSITIASQVIRFLGQWLRNHIKISDKKYSQFLNNRGVF